MTINRPVQNNVPPSLFTLAEAAEGIASHLGWHTGAGDTLRKQLMQAARDGTLTVRDPHTDVPYRPDPVRYFNEQVTRADVNEWAARVGVSWRWNDPTQVPQGVPAQNTATPASVAVGALGGDAWINKARERAAEIIKRQREKDLYPSQENLGDEIAREFRAACIVGADGKPLSGAYIKRHALTGISSAQGKQLSTRTGRGK